LPVERHLTSRKIHLVDTTGFITLTITTGAGAVVVQAAIITRA
jgi:hypothetical protein